MRYGKKQIALLLAGVLTVGSVCVGDGQSALAADEAVNTVTDGAISGGEQVTPGNTEQPGVTDSAVPAPTTVPTQVPAATVAPTALPVETLAPEVEKKTQADGWTKKGSTWHFFDEKGNEVKKAAGWYQIDKKWYYIKKNGTTYVGWNKIGKKKYYFQKQGTIRTGLQKIGGGLYYQTKEKGICTSAYVTVGKKRYHADATGKCKIDRLWNLLQQAYAKNVKSDMSKEQKLRAMYMYLATKHENNKNFVYERRYDDNQYIGKSGWTADYAYYMLSKKKGNCYRFACTFAYFAKMLGYDSYVRVGEITSRSGGMTPHGWVEIKQGGQTYVYDPEMQFAGGYDLYQKTYSTYPMKLNKGKLYKINY